MSEEQVEKKNSWMEKLSVESWQAELVISGVAIYGSFQLLDLVDGLIDFLYFRLPEELMLFAYFLCFYLLITASILILSFLSHFALRALWIANIGLASVYPNGIRRDNELFSERFMDQLFERFPSFNAFNENLDKICSSMLAGALTVVLSLAGIGVLLSMILLLSYIATQFLPEGLSGKIFAGLIAIVVVLLFFNAALASKSMQKKEWVQRIQFRLTLFIGGYVFGNIFHKPLFYLMYTVRTNTNQKRYWAGFVVFFMVVIFVSATQMSSSNIFLFMEPVYKRYDQRVDRMYAANYEDQIKATDHSIIRPTVPSEFMDDPNELRLFLPMPEREEARIFANCGKFVEPKDMEEDSVRLLRYAFRQECFQNSLVIRLNEQVVNDYILKTHEHAHRREPGLLFYFPDVELQAGENVISVQHYWQDGEGKSKVDRIPFFYTGD